MICAPCIWGGSFGSQSRELDGKEVEPPLPPGMGRLSASLESLASFLRVDRDLLFVAAENSKPLGDTNPRRDEVRTWVGRLEATEKDALIVDLMLHADYVPLMELVQRFLKEQSAKAAVDTVSRRTVAQLLREAETCKRSESTSRRQMRAEAKARHEREAVMATRKASPQAGRP